MDDDALTIDRFKNGERRAFDDLVIKYRKSVLNLIYRFTGRQDEAEDMAQEVFIRLYRSLKDFRGESSFFTYLYRVTLNLCFQERKKRAKAESRMSPEEDLEKIPSAATPHGEAETREARETVIKAVRGLPPDQRAVVILFRYHGLPYREICDILKIGMGTLKSRLHRAHASLKEKLRPYMEDMEIPTGTEVDADEL
ncbi:MAG: sigma-70 family RNA polymerase sigma factor [Chloroflexi bacterium]|nr:sigma-70 family RNA polymerase sigma factor [Chloroflexota bacterium]